MNEIKLQEVLTDRNNKFGQGVQTRFTDQALKALSPSLLHIAFYVGDETGEQYNKSTLADGSPNPLWKGDPPRDPEERKKFFLDLKSSQYEAWIKRLQDGEFDQVPAESAPSEPSRIEQDPTPNIPPAPAPKPDPEGVAIVKKESKPKNLTKPKPATDEVHPIVKMREAIEDIARGVVGPATDADLQEKIDELIEFKSNAEAKIEKLTMALKGMHTALSNMGKAVNDTIDKKLKEIKND
jgi:hypothetical protein